MRSTEMRFSGAFERRARQIAARRSFGLQIGIGLGGVDEAGPATNDSLAFASSLLNCLTLLRFDRIVDASFTCVWPGAARRCSLR